MLDLNKENVTFFYAHQKCQRKFDKVLEPFPEALKKSFYNITIPKYINFSDHKFIYLQLKSYIF